MIYLALLRKLVNIFFVQKGKEETVFCFDILRYVLEGGAQVLPILFGLFYPGG